MSQPDGHISRQYAPYPARVPDIIERWSPRAFYATVVLGALAIAGLTWLLGLWLLLLVLPWLAFTGMGLVDRFQKRHAIRRNFPVLGRLRYVLEGLRPEIRQYFVEADDEANPISRERRTIVYSRAKGQLDTIPFGTRQDVYSEGHEWIHHSLCAAEPPKKEARILIGANSGAKQPYRTSILNISAMSYGSLSSAAVSALNRGAKLGRFAHNTGEGGVSPYHLEHGGDLVWQIGTGYFGCRAADGGFDPDAYAAMTAHDHIKMIELKISQGAKPGHGGILPARKVTPEIAKIRQVKMGEDVLSPPMHRAFNTPIGLMKFIEQLRDLSGGKPVGFKICIGSRREFLAILRAIRETGILPDFIAIDGAEGGTGAAPLEFTNSVGTPLVDGLVFAHQALIGAGLRDQIKIMAAGKITTGFDILRLLALGADFTGASRSMMFALGCIQALKCNTNHCPVGVATQDPKLIYGLDVTDKGERVRSYHAKTVQAMYELLGAAGLTDPTDLRPVHIRRRGDDYTVVTYEDIYPSPEPGCLLEGRGEARMQAWWNNAHADTFQAKN